MQLCLGVSGAPGPKWAGVPRTTTLQSYLRHESKTSGRALGKRPRRPEWAFSEGVCTADPRELVETRQVFWDSPGCSDRGGGMEATMDGAEGMCAP